MKILFWQEVGGYIYCVLWEGQWYFVGHSMKEGLRMQDYYTKMGYQVERVQGVPRAIQQAWEVHGNTVAALEKALPKWEPK